MIFQKRPSRKSRASRWIALTLAASLIAGPSLAPRRAEAAWGLILASLTGTSYLAAFNFGSILFFVGAAGGGMASADFVKQGDRARGARSLVLYLIAGVAALSALYLLESTEDSAAAPRLAPVSDEASTKLGMSVAEREAYNSELPLINAVIEEAMARSEVELSKLEPARVTLEAAAGILRSNWRSLSEGTLSDDSVRAFEKISRTISNAGLLR